MSDESLSSQTETSAETTGSLLTEATNAEVTTEGEAAAPETSETQAPEGAPESYEFQLPEGATPGPVLEEFSAMAKEMNLPQDKAQALVDLYQKAQQETIKQWDATKQAWANEIKADKEIGGQKFKETMETCGRFLKEMEAPPEFLEFMDQYGLGNHPAFIKMIHKIALQTREDRPVMAGAGGSLTNEAKIQNLYSKTK